MSSDLGYELDRLAIMDLLIRYGTSVDSHNFEGIRSCLADDLVFVGFATPEARHGGDAYTDLIRELLLPFGATQHLLGNQVVRIDGDRAYVETDVQATPLHGRRPRQDHDALGHLRGRDGAGRRGPRMDDHAPGAPASGHPAHNERRLRREPC